MTFSETASSESSVSEYYPYRDTLLLYIQNAIFVTEIPQELIESQISHFRKEGLGGIGVKPNAEDTQLDFRLKISITP